MLNQIQRVILRALGIGYTDHYGYYQERFASARALGELYDRVYALEESGGLKQPSDPLAAKWRTNLKEKSRKKHNRSKKGKRGKEERDE